MKIVKKQMREARARARGGGHGFLRGRPRRSSSPVDRVSLGGMGARQGATDGGEGGIWLDVSPRRRKALQQEDSVRVRQRVAPCFHDRDDYVSRQSRFRFATTARRFL